MTTFFTIMIFVILLLLLVKAGIWILKILGHITSWMIKGLLIVMMVVGVVALLGIAATSFA